MLAIIVSEKISGLDLASLASGFKIHYPFGMETEITVAKIIKDAGGASAIERASHDRGGDLSRSAVYKWQQTGIPDRHWPIIIALTDYGPVELYEANCSARDAQAFTQESAA